MVVLAQTCPARQPKEILVLTYSFVACATEAGTAVETATAVASEVETTIAAMVAHNADVYVVTGAGYAKVVKQNRKGNWYIPGEHRECDATAGLAEVLLEAVYIIDDYIDGENNES